MLEKIFKVPANEKGINFIVSVFKRIRQWRGWSDFFILTGVFLWGVAKGGAQTVEQFRSLPGQGATFFPFPGWVRLDFLGYLLVTFGIFAKWYRWRRKR